MPTRRLRRFDPTGRVSGPRNHVRPGRRSSDPWRTGLPSSNSESEISRPRGGRARPGVAAPAAWRESFRRSSRSAPVRRRCRLRAATNAEDGDADEVVAAEARARPRRRSRERRQSRGRPGSLDRNINNRHARGAAGAGRDRLRRPTARRETAGRQTVRAQAHREMLIQIRRTAGGAGAAAVVAGRAVAARRIQAARRPTNHPPVDGKRPGNRE
jgi:hypothetical protein